MAAQKRVKILFFIHDLAPFGAQLVTLNIAKYLDKAAFSLTVCSFWGEETLAKEFITCGAEVVFLRARRVLDLSAWLRLARLLLKERPDIVQINLPELSVPVRLLALFLPGVKIVHSVQNPLSSEPAYWRLLNRATFRLCWRVIFCSESIKAEAGYGKGAGKGRFRAVQNGIGLLPAPASGRAAMRTSLGIKDGEKVACCVARLTRQKGQDILIHAASRLKKDGRRLRFLLAGDGEDLPLLKDLSVRLGVEEEIVFLGRREDIAAVLGASDIYAAPSRWEGLGIALGEAMLAGLPCVGTAIAGQADILKDGVTGLVVPPEDPAALAAGIARLLDNGEEASRLAAAALELIRGSFIVKEMSAKYEKIYLELAGDIHGG